MSFSVRNWDRYQHYKADRPAWIKWYREVTNDLKWIAMEDEGKLLFPYVLLVAAETGNEIPNDPGILAQRLHLKKRFVELGIDSLVNSRFLHIMQGDAQSAALRARVDAPSRETETETYKEETEKEFSLFWDAYPRKVGKVQARKAWQSANGERPPVKKLIAAIEALAKSEQWQDARFIPHPSTWLGRGGWDDEPVPAAPIEQTATRDMKCVICGEMFPDIQEHRAGSPCGREFDAITSAEVAA